MEFNRQNVWNAGPIFTCVTKELVVISAGRRGPLLRAADGAPAANTLLSLLLTYLPVGTVVFVNNCPGDIYLPVHYHLSDAQDK